MLWTPAAFCRTREEKADPLVRESPLCTGVYVWLWWWLVEKRAWIHTEPLGQRLDLAHVQFPASSEYL